MQKVAKFFFSETLWQDFPFLCSYTLNEKLLNQWGVTCSWCCTVKYSMGKCKKNGPKVWHGGQKTSLIWPHWDLCNVTLHCAENGQNRRRFLWIISLLVKISARNFLQQCTAIAHTFLYILLNKLSTLSIEFANTATIVRNGQNSFVEFWCAQGHFFSLTPMSFTEEVLKGHTQYYILRPRDPGRHIFAMSEADVGENGSIWTNLYTECIN